MSCLLCSLRSAICVALHLSYICMHADSWITYVLDLATDVGLPVQRLATDTRFLINRFYL